MMKKVLLILGFMLCWVCGSAQAPAYKGNIETGYSFGVGDHSVAQWLLQTVHGVDFIPDRLFVGGGIGLGISVESDVEAYTFPIFVDARYKFGQKRVRPYADMRAGYSFVWNDHHPGGNEGGFYFAPSVGVAFKVSSALECNVGLGYTVQRAHYEFRSDPHYNPTRINYNAGGLNLTVGLSF